MSQVHRLGPWKIILLSDGSWECVRIKPTEYFRATSLRSAMSAINRRERDRGEGISRQGREDKGRKSSLKSKDAPTS